MTILILKRSAKTAWFPSTIELSGGEGLAPSDFEEDSSGRNPMQNWFLRGVAQEFLPTRGLNAYQQREVAQKMGLSAKLYGIGYTEMDCSFPVFVVARSQLDLGGYSNLVATELARREGLAEFDREGGIGVLGAGQVRELLSNGQCEGRLMTIRGGRTGQARQISLTSPEAKLEIRLNRETLHPMTPFRIKIIADVLAEA